MAAAGRDERERERDSWGRGQRIGKTAPAALLVWSEQVGRSQALQWDRPEDGLSGGLAPPHSHSCAVLCCECVGFEMPTRSFISFTLLTWRVKVRAPVPLRPLLSTKKGLTCLLNTQNHTCGHTHTHTHVRAHSRLLASFDPQIDPILSYRPLLYPPLLDDVVVLVGCLLPLMSCYS